MLCPRTQHNNKLTQLGLQALSPDLDSSTHTKRPLCLRQTRVIIAKYYAWMNPQNSLNLMHHSFPICIVLKWNSLYCTQMKFFAFLLTLVYESQMSTGMISRIPHLLFQELSTREGWLLWLLRQLGTANNHSCFALHK